MPINSGIDLSKADGRSTHSAGPVYGASSRFLRPLLPKQTSGLQREIFAAEDTNIAGCGLSQCPNPDCTLQSHRLYRLTLSQRKSKKSAPSRYPRVFGVEWTNQTADWVDRRLSDGCPQLPTETHQLVQSKELFHYFFTQQMVKVRQIYIPFVEEYEYKTTSLGLALTSALHCVCILANAKIDMIMKRQCDTPDQSSLAVYGLAAYFLRKKLDDFSRQEIDFLIMLVVALAGFDFAFNRVSALAAHRSALKRLVALQGGLHVIDNYQSQVVAFVSKTDQMITTALGEYPLFNQEFGSHNFKLPDSPSGVYGEVWRDPKTLEYLDKDVVSMCLDSCRLIHMAETSDIAFYRDEMTNTESALMPFFVCLRGRVGVDFGRLYSFYHENQNKDDTDGTITASKSRCLVIACVLTDYFILWGDYYQMFRPRQATILLGILKRQAPDEWSGHVDMQLWIYFVLAAVVPRSWEGHAEVITILRGLLKDRYAGQWPQPGWEKSELNNLRYHMWSDMAYSHSYEMTCKDLLNESTSTPEPPATSDTE